MKITSWAGLAFGLQLFLSSLSAQQVQMQEGMPEAYAKLRLSGLETVARSNKSAAEDYVSASRTSTTDITVDSNTYIIGPGDQFFVMFLNRSTLSYFGVINPDGDLLVPSLGLFKLGKIPLSRAKELIREQLRKKNNTDEPLYIALSSVKNVTIFISGPVKYPGRFVVPGTMRLFDAVKIACDPIKPLLDELDGRSVVRTSGDSTATFDVMKFMYKGDLTQNPYLYSGDRITIPGQNRTALVLGAVTGPNIGIIPIKAGETVASLLSIFSYQDAADTTSVLLRRTLSDSTETMLTVPCAAFNDQAVYDRDVLTVPTKSNYPEMMSVVVTGEVERAGFFPMIRNRTTLNDMLKCTGLLPTALESKIAILRSSKAMPTPPNPQDKNNFIATLPQSFSRSEMNNSISLMMTAKDYTVIRYVDNKEVLLEQHDQIVVPRKEGTVYISGAVKRPGGYEFSEGKDLKHYIDLAGGFNKLADRQNLYRMIKYGDYMQYSSDRSVEDGDVIVVPFSKENKIFNNIFLPAFQILVTSVSLLLTVITVMR